MAAAQHTRRASAGRGTQAEEKAPTIRRVPIGLQATGTRREFDSLGDVGVPANRY
jgi:fumarate hydratase, class II